MALARGKPASAAVTWYNENSDTLALHPQTRSRIETLLGIINPSPYKQRVSAPRHREAGS